MIIDRDIVIWQIMTRTKYTEEYLSILSDEKLIEIYKLKVEKKELQG